VKNPDLTEERLLPPLKTSEFMVYTGRGVTPIVFDFCGFFLSIRTWIFKQDQYTKLLS